MDSERSDSSKPATPSPFQEQPPSPDIDLEQDYLKSQEEAIPIREARELAPLNETDMGFDSESSRPSPTIPPVKQRRQSRLTPPRDFLSEVEFKTGQQPLSEKPLPQPAQRLSSPLAPQARPIPKAPKQSFPTSFEQSPIRSPNTAAREWTRTVQPYSASPSNLINLSESPLTVPSSYDDGRSFAAGWTNDRDRRADRTETQYSQSTSPPTLAPSPPSLINNTFKRRPLSGQSQLPGGERRSMFEDDRISRQQPNNINNHYARRNSGYSQFTDQLRTPPQDTFQPPPTATAPMSQFYGHAPDINLGGGRRTNGLKPGERGYYVGFDTMNVIRGGQGSNKSVVITGYEGGLDVRQISKRGSTIISQLGGLRGGVYAAKILPWTVDEGPNITRGSTLIAVVVHGPVLEDNTDAVTFGEEAGDGFDKRRSGSTTGTEQRRRTAVTHYQTTVEIHDMRGQKYIANLLTLPRVECMLPFMGPRFTPPPPSGALSILAEEGRIVVVSGQTGEAWIFQQAEIKGLESIHFACLGKIWTTVQQPSATEPTDYSQRIGSDRSGGNNEQVKKTRTNTGLISLRGRWLVYCPSPNIHAISLRALVSTSHSPKSAIASINSYAPPQLPSANCTVDTPPGDSLTSRLGRQAAQGAIVGGKFLAEQGTKVFNNYWKPPAQTAQGWMPPPGEPSGQMFPPTHGSSSGKEIQASEAVIVGIIDLHKLANLGKGKKINHATVATFKLPDGCSYLSLSPSGLQLFTPNSRGDMHYIWDLLRLQYPKPSTLTLPRQGYPTTPHIRQIFRFERLTVSRIVDVVWTLPRGTTIAMVTERNTVHFFDIPGHVFAWPPPRRVRVATGNNDALTTARAVSAAPVVAARLATSAATSAFSTVRGIAGWGRRASQTQATLPPSTSNLSSLGNENGNTPAPNRSGALASTLSLYAGAGAKMAASGISKSLNSTMQTVQTLRQSNDNKLRLPASDSVCGANCIHWLGERRGGKQAFAVVLDGIVKIHKVQYVKGKAGGKGRKREPPRVVVKGHTRDIGIPSISDSMISDVVRQALELDTGDLQMASPSVCAVDDQSRTAVLPVQPLVKRPVARTTCQNPITMAEIETSTPYQPFHHSHNVTLYTYTNDSQQDDDENWTFGGKIEGERLDCGYEEDEEGDLAGLGEEPIVSTTRRRRGGEMGGSAELREEDGEGFFDEDVEWVDFE